MNADKFMSYMARRVSVDGASPGACWNWTGFIRKDGYGGCCVRTYGPKTSLAHRAVYIALIGEPQRGLTLDHLCRNRACVNPAHLEAVTKRENERRGLGGKHWRDKTHCPSGHEYTPENTYVYTGRRYCRSCHKRHSLAWARSSRMKKIHAGATSALG